MADIVLTILKIIGFSLAGIVGLLVLLSAVVLFAHVRYELRAVKTAMESQTAVNFKLSWFMGFLRVGYDGKNIKIIVFWFYKLGKNKSRKKKKAPQSTVKEARPKRLIKDILGGIKHIWDAIPDKGLIWKNLMRLIKKTLRALKPKIFKLCAEIGLENPAETGWLLGFLGILKGIWMLPMEVSGNFQEKALSYNIYVKDKFMLFSLAGPFIGFCLKKPVWRLITKHILKKEDADEPEPNPELRSSIP